MKRRDHHAITLLFWLGITLPLGGCSWAEFKDFGYTAMQEHACNDRNRHLPTTQQSASTASGCFPQNDVRSMTAAQYDAERKRALGAEAVPGSADRPATTAEEQTRAQQEIDSSGTAPLGSPAISTRPVHPEG